MEFNLRANQALQNQLKGDNPKDIYLPLNAGRTSGNKKPNPLSGKIESDKISLLDWINNQIEQETIVLPGAAESRPYKVYTALLTQTGTAAPVPIVLENTLGGIVTFSRIATGTYTATLFGAFTVNKTSATLSNTLGMSNTLPSATSSNVIALLTRDNNTGVTADSKMTLSLLEIKVYN